MPRSWRATSSTTSGVTRPRCSASTSSPPERSTWARGPSGSGTRCGSSSTAAVVRSDWPPPVRRRLASLAPHAGGTRSWSQCRARARERPTAAGTATRSGQRWSSPDHDERHRALICADRTNLDRGEPSTVTGGRRGAGPDPGRPTVQLRGRLVSGTAPSPPGVEERPSGRECAAAGGHLYCRHVRRRPSARMAFSFMISGLTSSRISSCSKSLTHRSGRISG